MAHNHDKGLCDVYHNEKLIFIRVSSNASTSIRLALGKSNVDNYLSIINNKKEENKYITFAIIRDPIERLVSGYIKVCVRATADSPEILNKEFYWIKDQKMRFYAFIDELEKGYFDCHIELQRFFLTDENNNLFDIDYILMLENLDEDFSKMCRELNLDKKLSHLNKVKMENSNQLIRAFSETIRLLSKVPTKGINILFNNNYCQVNKSISLSKFRKRVKKYFSKRPLPKKKEIMAILVEDPILQQRVYELYETDFELYDKYK